MNYWINKVGNINEIIVQIAIAVLIGYIDDATGPKEHHYENRIVIVYEKYQCPVYCGVDHNHYVYFEGETNGMVIDKAKLGKRVKKKKNHQKK